MSVKKYIFNFKYFNIFIIIFVLIFIFSFLEYEILSIILSLIFFTILFIKVPYDLITKEFFKKKIETWIK